MIPQQCMHSKERLASSSIDEVDCPKNMRTTSSMNACTYTLSFPSKESRMRLQKKAPSVSRCGVNVHRVVCSFNIKWLWRRPTSILSMVLPSTGSRPMEW
ncbi:hypothetical protein EVAR_62811_1 [Eumeta japonica]|uniref:Uncharacterized protein n=1 Tax=Eumeta variegata TaxID=151549 RepID=A0A4C1ZKB2_EUMVA|nr:hypothetical protein EVAR_62811_1 [Eumeta japonica]